MEAAVGESGARRQLGRGALQALRRGGAHKELGLLLVTERQQGGGLVFLCDVVDDVPLEPLLLRHHRLARLGQAHPVPVARPRARRQLSLGELAQVKIRDGQTHTRGGGTPFTPD